MSLPRFAQKYTTIVVTAMVLLILWGTTAYFTMPRREDPEFTVRTCLVLTSWPGAPVVKVEELITEKLEKEIDTLDGIRWVRSETTVGQSAIFVAGKNSFPGASFLRV